MKLSIFSLLLILLISACGQEGGEDLSNEETGVTPVLPVDIVRASPSVPVVVTTILPQDFDEIIELTGTVEAMNDVVVSAETSGRIQWIAPLGSRVGKGGMIARMDDRVVQSNYDAAKSQYDLSLDTFGRQQALYQDSVISSLEFQAARASKDQTKAQLAQAEKMLADARPRSPFRGTIQDHLAKAGSLVGPGSPILRIVDTRTVKIVAGVPERYAADIRSGAKAMVAIGDAGEEMEGRISFVSDIVDPSNRTFDVEIKLDNRAGKVKPAMVSKVAIQKNTIKDAIVVPRNAVVTDELGKSVFIVTREGDSMIARKVNVTIGPSLGNATVIESGLASGAQIIVVGQKKISDGSRVELSSTDQ